MPHQAASSSIPWSFFSSRFCFTDLFALPGLSSAVNRWAPACLTRDKEPEY